MDLGENAEMALKREAAEELGLKDFEPVLLETYVYESDVEKELVFTYRCTCAGPIAPSGETDGGAFWKLEDITAQLEQGVFTPNFETEYRRFFLKEKAEEKEL